MHDIIKLIELMNHYMRYLLNYPFALYTDAEVEPICNNARRCVPAHGQLLGQAMCNVLVWGTLIALLIVPLLALA